MMVAGEDERSLSPVTPRARKRAAVHAASTPPAHAEAIKQLEDMATGYAMHAHELEATIDGMRRREREQAGTISGLEQVVRDSRVSAKDMQELEHMASGYAAQVTELESRVVGLVAEREASDRQAEQLLKDVTHAEEFAKVVVAQKQRIAELEGSLAGCEQGSAAQALELQRRAHESEERSERLEAVVAELRARPCDGASTPRMTQECGLNPDIDGEKRRRLQLEAEICSLRLDEQEHLGKIAQLQEALQTQSMQTVHLCPSIREKDAQRIAELEALTSEMTAREQEHLQEIARLQSGGPPGAVQEACAKAQEMEELAIGHARRSNELEALVCTMREAEQGHLEDMCALRASCAASEGLASERTKELEEIANHQGYRGTVSSFPLVFPISTEPESTLQKRVAELEAGQGACLQMEAELQELRGKVAQQEREYESARQEREYTLEQLRNCRRREQEVGSQVALLEAEVGAHRQKEAELTRLVKAVQQREARIAEMEKQLGHGAEAAAAEAPAQVVERLASIPAAASTRAPPSPRHAGSQQCPFAGPARAALGACGGPGHLEWPAATGVTIQVGAAEGRCASPMQVRAAVAVLGQQAIPQSPRRVVQQRCASPVVVRRAAQPRCATPPVRAQHPPLVLTPRAWEAQQQRCASPVQSRPGWQRQGVAEAARRAASPMQPHPARAGSFVAEPGAPQARPAWASTEGGLGPDRGVGRDTPRSPSEGWSTMTAPTTPLLALRAPTQR